MLFHTIKLPLKIHASVVNQLCPYCPVKLELNIGCWSIEKVNLVGQLLSPSLTTLV